jgi:hypothetical protein
MPMSNLQEAAFIPPQHTLVPRVPPDVLIEYIEYIK